MKVLAYNLYDVNGEKTGRIHVREGKHTHLYGVKVNYENPQREIEDCGCRAEFVRQATVEAE